MHDEELIYDYNGKRSKTYVFDQVFNEQATNVDVYGMTLQPLIPNLLEGYNVTCFAYGMTGAGKTFTMIGHNEANMGLCF